LTIFNSLSTPAFFIKLSLLFFLIIGLNACKKEDLADPSLNNIPDITSLDEIENPSKQGIWLLFFHNTWSENCFKIRPFVEAIAEDSRFEFVQFAEIDFDANAMINGYFAVRGFPTILIYKNGFERHRLIGSKHTQIQIEDLLLKLKD
jgi:thiol-disulfide isomerase/thioredoxin